MERSLRNKSSLRGGLRKQSERSAHRTCNKAEKVGLENRLRHASNFYDKKDRKRHHKMMKHEKLPKSRKIKADIRTTPKRNGDPNCPTFPGPTKTLRTAGNLTNSKGIL